MAGPGSARTEGLHLLLRSSILTQALKALWHLLRSKSPWSFLRVSWGFLCVAQALFELPEHALGPSWAFLCASVAPLGSLPEDALGLRGASNKFPGV